MHERIICRKLLITEEPKPSLNCPRQNGYFAAKDKSICDKFYYCVDGMFNMITCPDGLVFNHKTGICTWPDEAHKKGCSSQGELSNHLTFLRFATYCILANVFVYPRRGTFLFKFRRLRECIQNKMLKHTWN